MKKRAGNIALAVGLGAILNIVLNFLLIPEYGIYGAGIASILAFGLIVVFNFIIAEKTYPVGYNFILVIIPVIILLLIAAIPFFVHYELYQTFVKIGLLCIVSIISYKYFKRIATISQILHQSES